MKWRIPAKTFLLGEYAAIAGASAIILSTEPYFELSLNTQERLEEIHPDSPAGVYWQKELREGHGLSWYDPYAGRGGLGASSAQFLGAYLASCHLQKKTPDLNALLQSYYHCAWSGVGLKPSGYDVIAQSQQGCVYINKQQKKIQSYAWPFKDLSFLLIHTGIKLATHHHLQDITLPSAIEQLSMLVDDARAAFESGQSALLVKSVNEYHQKLSELQLVAPHSLDFINEMKACDEVLAIKGCGALGSDTILILTRPNNVSSLRNKLIENKCMLLASEENITSIDSKALVDGRL